MNNEKPILIDAHVHAREQWTDEFRETVPIYSANSASVYMMNFKKALDLSHLDNAVELCREYYRAIMDLAFTAENPLHRALLMPVLAESWEPEQLRSFIKMVKGSDIPLAGFKLFTQGQSTNSGYAPSIAKAQKLIDEVESAGLPLCLHMEDPDERNASKKEVSAIQKILPQFVERNGKPRDMKISVEHVSTWETLREVVDRGLWCTITPHHMGLCQEDFGIIFPDMAETMLRTREPYFYCKPILQTRKNQKALRKFWMGGGYDKLMPGTDSAPWTIEDKESAAPHAGIFLGGAFRAYLEVGCGVEVDTTMPKVAGSARSLGESGNADIDAIRPLIQNYSLNAARFYGINPATLPAARVPDEKSLFFVQNGRTVLKFGKTKVHES